MKANSQKATAYQIMVAIAALVVVIAGMRAATTIVVPFLLAAFIAIISAPPMFWLHRKGLPVWFSLLIVIVITSYSIHYTKLYETFTDEPTRPEINNPINTTATITINSENHTGKPLR